MAGGKKEKELLRLDKFLVDMGKATRSQAKEFARKGRIRVNGSVVKSADLKIRPETDVVELDGATVGFARMEYYMLNKPQGVVSATEDGRFPTVVGLLTEAVRKDLFPVGRLDIDTEGLLLITNDGMLAHNLLAPKKHVDKTYLAQIEGTLPKDAVSRMEKGILLEDGVMTRPALLEILGGDQVKLTIHEGKFHQVKRMFEALGCRVVYLKRLSMGPLTLDENLKPGEYRALTEDELTELLAAGGKA